MRGLWNSITIEDLDTGYKNLSRGRKDVIHLEALDLSQMEITKWLNKEMLKTAVKRLYEAKNDDDLVFAQACIWMEQIRQKKIENLAKQIKK